MTSEEMVLESGKAPQTCTADGNYGHTRESHVNGLRNKKKKRKGTMFVYVFKNFRQGDRDSLTILSHPWRKE